MTLEEVEAAGGYSIIYADPAWHYNNKGRGAAENHYATMKVDEICALPVKRLARPEGAVLFMWATGPNLLIEAPRVIDAWGFKYKTVGFTWVKYHEKSEKRCVGGGYWTRSNPEFCLLAVSGKPPERIDRAVRQLVETGTEDVVLAPRGEHSAKPPEVRERIVQLLGDLPRVELFARERAAGWDAWGNEVPGGSDVTL